MKRFSSTKCLLAAAVALALPSLAVAGQIGFEQAGQNTYSSALIRNADSTVKTRPFVVAVNTFDEISGLNSMIKDTTRLTVRVKLAGAEFAGATLPSLVPGDVLGAQLGGGSATVVTQPTYTNSNDNSEFAFQVTIPNDPAANVAGFAVRIPSYDIKELVSSVGAGGSVTATVTLTVQGLAAPVLTESFTLAKGADGLVFKAESPEWPERKISVATKESADARRVYADMVDGDDESFYNAGGFTLKVKDDAVGLAAYTGGAGAAGKVLGRDATAVPNTFKVPAGATVTVTVSGSDFAPWLPSGNAGYAGSSIWLDTDSGCSTATPGVDRLNVSNTGSSATSLRFSADAAATTIWGTLAGAADSAKAYLCFGKPSVDGVELAPQVLSASVAVNYGGAASGLANPSAYSLDLLNLGLTGVTTYFQNVSPAGNPRNDSILRLTNHNTSANGNCTVRIVGKDDLGDVKGPVVVQVPNRRSIDITSAEFETGTPRFEGSFGDGQGRWQLRATAECAAFTMGVIQRNFDTGVLSDLHAGTNKHEW